MEILYFIELCYDYSSLVDKAWNVYERRNSQFRILVESRVEYKCRGDDRDSSLRMKLQQLLE